MPAPLHPNEKDSAISNQAVAAAVPALLCVRMDSIGFNKYISYQAGRALSGAGLICLLVGNFKVVLHG